MNQVTIYARKSTESEDRQVMSIDSQIKELKQHAIRMNWKVVAVYTESKSAKAPGRDVFNQMYQEIQAGRIQELLCWKLDRLARNPVDGGALIWAMEEKKLTKIHTPQSTFCNSGNDKFWLQMEFGMAKKYVDDLSDNVIRGLKAKLENGWFPSKAPVGYLNKLNDHTIIPNPELFDTVRYIWDLVLMKHWSPAKIHRFLSQEKRFRKKLSVSKSGRLIGRSTIFTILSNPFYYGVFRFRGELYKGKHQPMITKQEFDKVQKILDKGYTTRPKNYEFTYTGLIKCGECGASVTAEHKTNRRYGQKYIYYHCTKKIKQCSQRYLEEKVINEQVITFLDSISLDKDIYQVLINIVDRQKKQTDKTTHVIINTIERNIAKIEQSLSNLLTLRLDNLITDDEYLSNKEDLEQEKTDLESQLNIKKDNMLHIDDKIKDIFKFTVQLRECFENGTIDDKKRILREIGSNLFLRDKLLLITANKPFDIIQKYATPLNEKKSWFEPRFTPV